MAEALYRKYRPQVFEDVVGQEPISRTLKNAIAQDKVSHAYLFCGPRGTGKTTTARLLAKALLCQAGPTPEPDGICEDCRLIADGVHPDVYELDAASRTGVENVREEIISRVQFAPTRGRNKIYIIDEVHMLSVAAFNALLKTLEEPPEHVVFVLCTTDPQKVPETIHSRCQRFDFRRIAPESMVARLGAICIAEGVEFEGEALDLVAHRAEGGLRNALTSLEQIIAFENGRVTLAGAERLLGSIDSNDMAEIISCVGQRDIANCFRWTAAYVETGADLAQFVRDMSEHVRNLYVLSLVGDDVDLEISETMRHELTGELQWFGPDRLARLMGVLGDLSAELKTSSNPRLAFEIALTRMARPDSDLTLESLAERVEALESGYSAVAHVVPGAAAFGREGESRASGAAGMRESYQAADAGPGASSIAPAGVGPVQGVAQAASPASGVPASGEARASSGWQQPSQPASQQFAAEAQPQRMPVETGGQPTGRDDSPLRADASPAGQGQEFGQAGRVSGEGDMAMLANPATLQRVWQATLSAVKKQKQAYGVLFMNAKARFDEESRTLRVVFPTEAAFAFNAVQKADVQEALGAALAHAAGMAVPFRYEKAGQQGADGARTAHAAAHAAVRDFSEQRAQASQRQPQQQPQQAQPQQAQQPRQTQQPQPQQAQTQQQQPQARPQSQAQEQAQPQAQPPQQAQAQPQGRPQQQVQQQPQPQSQAQTQQQTQSQAQTQAQSPEGQQADAQAMQQLQAQARPRPQQQQQHASDQRFQPQQRMAETQPPWSQPSPWQENFQPMPAQAVGDGALSAEPQASGPSAPMTPEAAPRYDDAPPYDDMPPYDDGYYEQVPYEELGEYGEYVGAGMSQAPAPIQVSPAGEPVQPNSSEAEEQVDVEALLQAGFGGGVVITEIGE